MPPEIFGGVATITQILADHLRDQRQQISIAFPATRTHRPELNAASLLGQPSIRYETAFNGHNCIAVGTRLPELEFTYSKPSPLWQSIIEDHDFHVAVCGTPVMATPLVSAGVPHFVWCASDVLGDRIDRQKAYSVPRRLVDRFVVMPRLQAQERRVLGGGGRVMTISPYSMECLNNRNSRQENDVGLLSIPTDMNLFKPPDSHAPGWRLGFAGRLSDPRKNAALLLDTVADLRKKGQNVSLTETGEATAGLNAEVSRRGLGDVVNFAGILNATELRDFYQNLDVFVIPSFQEGHAIVGIEAMASGVPVISTRCGGPEAYIRNNENGYLTGFDVAEVTRCISEICENPARRQTLSENARKSVVEGYGFGHFRKNLNQLWRETFGSDL